MSNETVIQNFTEYLDSLVLKFAKKPTKTRDIYLLKIEHTFKENKTPNPEFGNYQQKKQNAKELMKDKKKSEIDDETSKIWHELCLEDVPPKHIIETKKESKVVKKHIKSFIKPFDTLYLRKVDIDNLVSSLKMFKNKDTIFTDLGITKKNRFYVSW
jgi:hypothetical protein